jgi:hypothetical protein
VDGRSDGPRFAGGIAGGWRAGTVPAVVVSACLYPIPYSFWDVSQFFLLPVDFSVPVFCILPLAPPTFLCASIVHSSAGTSLTQAALRANRDAFAIFMCDGAALLVTFFPCSLYEGLARAAYLRACGAARAKRRRSVPQVLHLCLVFSNIRAPIASGTGCRPSAANIRRPAWRLSSLPSVAFACRRHLSLVVLPMAWCWLPGGHLDTVPPWRGTRALTGDASLHLCGWRRLALAGTCRVCGVACGGVAALCLSSFFFFLQSFRRRCGHADV